MTMLLAQFNTKAIGAGGVALATSSTVALIHMLTSGDWLLAMFEAVAHHGAPAPISQAVGSLVGILLGLVAAYLGRPITGHQPF